MGLTTSRLAGDDRYATSALVASHGLALGMEPAFLWVASGGQFADALASGPAANWRGASLLLVPPAGAIPASTSVWLKEHVVRVEELQIVGGAAAIGADVERELRSVLVGESGG